MPLLSMQNYLVPASGNCNGWMVASPADGEKFQPDQVASVTGQPFVPTGVYADGTSAAGVGTITVMPIGIKFRVFADSTTAHPFPSVDGVWFEFEGCADFKLVFVDYPVIPFVQ